jgi:hypothetical protein
MSTHGLSTLNFEIQSATAIQLHVDSVGRSDDATCPGARKWKVVVESRAAVDRSDIVSSILQVDMLQPSEIADHG